MKLAKFFQNNNGEVKVVQPPNLLLSLWLILQIPRLLFRVDQPALTVLAGMVLFAWAYNELRQGESPFRKCLGGVILLIILINLFMQW